ncbi:hypothetical protein [Lacticaseibacillus porcinae]|uniref:hypothetical protein n=1 Tax=Lacticaseibacillus porcinae TaxID=1123687 RepID=UPI000F791272|nr:hypothetical protein [Lacticaseibacillus porcinae]
MENRTQRILNSVYWIFACLTVIGSGYLLRSLQTAQTMRAVQNALQAQDDSLLMQLQQANFTNELWIMTMMATLFAAFEVNAPLMQELQRNGWALALKARKPWAYTQIVLFGLFMISSFTQPISSIRWIGVALIIAIGLVTWRHWQNIQQYREYYSDPANYLIER